jgi:ABC-type nitrate/sulfonate/bicarbonate transport system substrate-binding protein
MFPNDYATTTVNGMQRTAFQILLGLVLASVSLSSHAFSQERPRLRVSTLFIGSSLLPFWVAQDQGHFNRAGVDVEIIWMQSNLSTNALLAGEVDVVFGTPQVPLTVAVGVESFAYRIDRSHKEAEERQGIGTAAHS